MTRAKKVLLIGWDAADWKVIGPLMDAGQMPHLERFVDEGVMGNLATLYPVLSPMLWTSIATGKRAHKHGIHGFAELDPHRGTVRPVTNLCRKTKALWNILHQRGLSSNVVGWWPSHPAEPIRGVMVSNHFQKMRAPVDKPWPMPPGTVHPKDRRDMLKKFRVHPGELEPEQILPFVPKAAQVDQEKDKRLSSIAKILAETASIHAVATAIMQMEPWDFMAVYYDSIDHFCHGFMRYHPPRQEWIPEEDYEIYKHVVAGAYRFHDLMLGALMALAGEETTVVLVSDHGFHPDHLRPRHIGNEPAGPADEHRQFGVFAMRGPGVKKDELVFGAGLLDIAPTVLTLFGLPVGRDMDGRPLLSAFEIEPEVEYVDSWDDVEGDAGLHAADVQVDSVDTQESLQQLVDLGYIEKPDEDKSKAAAGTVRELRYNLARSHVGAGMLAEAVDIFAELWEESPDESRFGVKLLEGYLGMGKAAEARGVYGKLVREKARYAREAREELGKIEESLGDGKLEDLPEEERTKIRKLRLRAGVNAPAFAYLHGSLLLAEGKHEKAIEELRKAEEVQVHNRPSLYQKLGECYLALENYDEAEAEFRRILEVDPADPASQVGLARCHLASGRPKKALDRATAAVGLVFHNPRAHFLCGKALRQLGRPEEAIRSLTTALAQNPVYPEAHRLLATIHEAHNRMSKALQHRKLADASEERIAAAHAESDRPSVSKDLAEDLPSMTDQGDLAPGEFAQDTVVVVSGLPRSGTSMMMQMLEAGGLELLTDRGRAADEDNPRGYYELEKVKSLARDRTWLDEAVGKGVKIIAQLLPALPLDRTYRVLFMERPLGEVLASQAAMLKRLGREGAGRDLARSFRKQLDSVRRVLQAHPNRVAVLGIGYHATLTDPEATAARVNAFLGGHLNEAAMAAAVAPQMRRQYLD